MKSILVLTALMFASGSVYAGNGSGTMFPLTKIAYNQTETLAAAPAIETDLVAASADANFGATEFVYFVKTQGDLVQFKYVSLLGDRWQMTSASASAQDLLQDRSLATAIASSGANRKWVSVEGN